MAEQDKDTYEAKWELINAELSARLARQEPVLGRIEAKSNAVGALALVAAPVLAANGVHSGVGLICGGVVA